MKQVTRYEIREYVGNEYSKPLGRRLRTRTAALRLVRRLCAETDAALTELARVRDVARNALEFAEVCLLARHWFENNPTGALDEIEHRAQVVLGLKSA